MAYYTSGVVGPRNQPLEQFPSSSRSALSAAIDEAWLGNPTQVLGDTTQFRQANEFELVETAPPEMAETEGGAAIGFRRPGGSRRLTRSPIRQENRLSQDEAQQYFKERGLSLTAPSEGLSRQAAQILADRKREENIRKDILNRAPDGFTQAGVRLGASLAVSLLDPLNIASAFVPVVGPARYTAMLERAGISAVSRAGVRARVGAIEGAAGAAMLEPLVYAGRTQLQDDYDMTDSLLNVAFGTVLGGGLHVVGGRISDYVAPPVRQIESRIAADEPIIALDSIPAQPSRAGIPMGMGLARPDPIAPFPRLVDLTPDRAQQLALSELEPEFRARLSDEASRAAEPGAIRILRTQAEELQTSLSTLQSDSHFRSIAKQVQRTGLSRKQAEASARRNVAEAVESARESLRTIQDQIGVNRQAAQAQQDLALLNKGETPERFSQQVQDRSNQLLTQAALQGAFPARHLISMASPQARQDALRVAVSQAVSGKNIDVEPIIRGDEQGVLAAARRQSLPESSSGVDFQASEAATARLSYEVGRADASAAQADLDATMRQLNDAIDNLEQGGFDPNRIEGIRQELASFDEMQADAKSLASATRAAALCGLRG